VRREYKEKGVSLEEKKTRCHVPEVYCNRICVAASWVGMSVDKASMFGNTESM
jgi:hypothetical protein